MWKNGERTRGGKVDAKNKFQIYFNFVRAVGDPPGWAFSISVLGVHPFSIFFSPF